MSIFGNKEKFSEAERQTVPILLLTARNLGYTPIVKQYLEIDSIIDADLLSLWDYLLTIACSTAFISQRENPVIRLMKLLRSIAWRIIPTPVRRLLNRGSARFCPVCESWVARFRPFGVQSRPNAKCPVCSSLERDRLIWLFFRQKTDLFDGRPKRLLHVAPEPQLSRRLKRVPGVDYVSIDLAWGKAMMRANVTDLLFPQDSFDVVYCSHVLEHIPNDRKAIAELYRVLKPDGWAILQVPIKSKTTLEDSSVTDPAERQRVFGQWDHVRIYGEDYVDRLKGAGFKVTVELFAKELSEEAAKEIAISRSERIYLCRK